MAELIAAGKRHKQRRVLNQSVQLTENGHRGQLGHIVTSHVKMEHSTEIEHATIQNRSLEERIARVERMSRGYVR